MGNRNFCNGVFFCRTLYIYMYIHPSIHASKHSCIHPSTQPSIHPPRTYIYIYISSLSVCLSVSVSLSLSLLIDCFNGFLTRPEPPRTGAPLISNYLHSLDDLSYRVQSGVSKLRSKSIVMDEWGISTVVTGKPSCVCVCVYRCVCVCV